ncbi:hypothetical protein RUM44_009892 [Polyplax serrata]|uniref:CUE domain-containing protein n=1 Tax=Polyplax serrata TaxID=468196 RepID=A0ABR1AU01_POLSC
MSDNVERYNTNTYGFENRFESRNRRQFYTDGSNRPPTWEESRSRYRTLFHHFHQESPSHSYRQGDMTPLQHGSIDILDGYNGTFPNYSSTAPSGQAALQLLPSHYGHGIHASLHQDMQYNCRPSPVFTRGVGTVMGAIAFQHKTHGIEALSANTDELVLKIAGTFPTVSETHIRCLLKKYHNREAVVMSALQVEKHPIATPGPFTSSPLSRKISIPGNCTPFQMTPPLSMRGTPSTSLRRHMATPPQLAHRGTGTPPLGVWGTPPTRGSSPVLRPGSGSSYYSSPAFGDYRQSPKSQSSPKLKLRYLKSIFPKVDETLLLDTLAAENNNVTKTAEKLKILGHEKKDAHLSKSNEKKKKDDLNAGTGVKGVLQNQVEIQKPTPPPRMKSLEEKNRMKARLGGLYEEIPERLIQIAIESVNYDEEKARHLLMLMINEEKENKEDIKDLMKGDPAEKNVGVDLQDRKKEEDKKKGLNEKKIKSKREVSKVSRGTSTAEDKEFKSKYRTKAVGRDKDLCKGPNDQLLLADYMTWNGPNPELRVGPNKALRAEGSNQSIVKVKNTKPEGPQKTNWKGPNLGLAKGSIYSQLIMILKG